MARCLWPLPAVMLMLCSAALADGRWADRQFAFRRGINVNWDAQHGSDRELAEVIFLTAGQVNPDGTDLRVATQDGKPVPSQVLMVGPGDLARVAFSLVPGVRDYQVYFGNPHPAAGQAPDFKFTCGLLLETKLYSGGPTATPQDLQSSWDDGGPLIGRELIDLPFLGGNPFGDQPRTISKYTGQISAPVDGEYTLAASIDTRGALFLDGGPILMVPGAVGDIRYRRSLTLGRGRHELVIYQLHDGSSPSLSVCWRRPDMAKIDVIGRDAFGVVFRGNPGPLESRDQPITADFSADYLGECFCAGNYSHRYRFTAAAAQQAGGNAAVQWDFGDGQAASGSVVEHVFATDGVYPVRVTLIAAGNRVQQTHRLAVRRDFANLAEPATDPLGTQAAILAQYDVATMPLPWLPWVTLMQLRAQNTQPMFSAASRLAQEKSHPDRPLALDALQQVTQNQLAPAHLERLVALWDGAADDSDLQPQAAIHQANLLIWYVGDFAGAVARLSKLAAQNQDADLQRTYAQALILDGQEQRGGEILRRLASASDQRRRPVLSGAMARTIEFYIRQGDWASGLEAWDQWQRQDPAAFLEGYSVLLRVQLAQLQNFPAAAATFAQAFAAAAVHSPYSPQLLDRAAKLLAKSDPRKSAELRQTLKQRYPEDPLSQD